MPTAYIADQAVDLPTRFSAGDILDADEAALLQREFIKRLASQVRWRVSRNEIGKKALPIEAWNMAQAFVFTDEPFDEDDDPIMLEAISIARELITKSLAESGITVMPKLDDHAKELAKNSEEIRARARLRVEARYKVAREALANL